MPKKIEKPEQRLMLDGNKDIKAAYLCKEMDTYLETIADEALNVLFKIKS